ncbi:MAG: hypothetical protein U0R52_07355 [Solirubrobacterales bacterium]
MPRIIIGAICTAALLVPATSASAFTVHLKAPGHHPKAGKPWKITVSAKRKNGRKVHAAALYKFLFNGSVVGTSYPSPNNPCSDRSRQRPYRFFGSYTDRLCFPSRSVGIPLTLRVVVRAGPLGTKHVDYDIKVED